MGKDWSNEAYQKLDTERMILSNALMEIGAISKLDDDLLVTQIKEIVTRALEEASNANR